MTRGPLRRCYPPPVLLLLAATFAFADCPRVPELRDPDGTLTVLEQNLKFIATGARRSERAALLAHYLTNEGGAVDLLLLSEARITDSLEDWPDWCFYTQTGDGLRDGYRWTPIQDGRSPGGLAMGVRQNDTGTHRVIGAPAGKRYRAKPVTLAEGLLGRIFNFRKGWATLTVDGTQLVWTHTQASYGRHPEKGAGGIGHGRAGQFTDLADDLGHPAEATLLTGDLNLLAGFTPHCSVDEPRVCKARAIDDVTVTNFRDRTGLDLSWFANAKTFAGTFHKGTTDDPWDLEASYDRVGVNPAFLARHPGTEVHLVDIGNEVLRVSDHLGLTITIPFAP